MRERAAIQLALVVAERQGYVLSRSDLLRRGVHTAQIVMMTRTGLLVRMHPGVFALGPRATDPIVAVRAAVRYAGPGAVASHRTAAWLQGLVDRPGGLAHVTMRRQAHRMYGGMKVHSSGALPTLGFKGIRCTTPDRTIVDLAPSLTKSELNEVIDRAMTLGLTTVDRLATEAGGRRRGCAMVRRSLKELGHIGVPDASVLEAGFRRLITRRRLPVPETQVKSGLDGRYRVDSAWVAWMVVTEVYGYAWHHSPEQLAYDSARQNELTAAGWTVLTFTWKQVYDHPDQVAAVLERVFERRAA